MEYVSNILDIKEINNKKENKEMYKVKNMAIQNGELIQSMVKEWIESRDHISIVSINIWCNGESNKHYATIIYREVQYIG